MASVGWGGAGVFRHTEVVEDEAGIAVQLAHGLRHAADAFGLDQTDGKAPESGDVFGAVAGADAAAVFVIVPVEDVVTATLDAPMAAIHLEYLLWSGLIRWPTGEAIGGFAGTFAGFLVDRLAFDDEGLPDVGEVEIGIEGRGGPDFSDLDPSVIAVDGDGVGCWSAAEEQGEIQQQGGLIGFDGKVVVGVSLHHQIVGECALGQQGIGGDILAGDVEGVEQRDGGLDFIDLLGLFIARYRQGADFFWV